MPAPAPAHAQPATPTKPSRPTTDTGAASVAHAEPPARHAAAPSNAPLSLSPNAPRAGPHGAAQHAHGGGGEHQLRRARQGRRAHACRARQDHGAGTDRRRGDSGGGYAVQISSRRSEADAQAAFNSLQARYPQQLGGGQPLIRRVDLGAKGVYYRAMVGPFGSSDEASQAVLAPEGGRRLVLRPEDLALPKLDPCGGRGLIRADACTRIHHRAGGTDHLRQ